MWARLHNGRPPRINYATLDMKIYFKEPYEKRVGDLIEAHVNDFENAFFPKSRSIIDVLRDVMVTDNNNHILDYLDECRSSGLLRFEFHPYPDTNHITITVRDLPKDETACREKLKPFKRLIQEIATCLKEQKLKAKLFLEIRNNDPLLTILKECNDDN